MPHIFSTQNLVEANSNRIEVFKSEAQRVLAKSFQIQVCSCLALSVSGGLSVHRVLHFTLQLTDRRSQVVRDVCAALNSCVTIMGPAARPLVQPLVHSMIDIAGSGNRVIAGYVGETLHTAIMFVRPRNLTSVIADVLDGGPGGFKTSSPACREACAECLRTALETFPAADLGRQEEEMLSLALRLVRDASEAARNTARICIAVHRFHFGAATEQRLKTLQPRDAKAVHELKEWLDPACMADTVAPVQCTGERSADALASTSTSVSALNSSVASPTHRDWQPVDGHVAATGDAEGKGAGSPGRHVHAGDMSPASSLPSRTASGDSSTGRKAARGTEAPGLGDDSELENCPDKHGQVLQVGTAVRLHLPASHGGSAPSRKEALAWVRWIGLPSFAEGVWCGLQLDNSTGKHSGTVKGHEYFTCPPRCGVFVRPRYLVVDPAAPPLGGGPPAHSSKADAVTVPLADPPVPKRAAVSMAPPADLPAAQEFVPATLEPVQATLPEVLAECRAHMDNMLQVLRTEFTTASALASAEGAHGDDGEDVAAAVRVMLGAVQERLALDKMWFVRLTALQMGAPNHK